MKVTLRNVTLDDIESLAPRLRQSDLDEIKASHGDADAYRSLLGSVSVSDESLVAELGGKAILVAGVAPFPYLPGVGTPWLLAAEEIEQVPQQFFRQSRRLVDQWQERYPVLTQWVDLRNALSQKWLLWLGFRIAGIEHEYGVEKRPFLNFVRSRHSV